MFLNNLSTGRRVGRLIFFKNIPSSVTGNSASYEKYLQVCSHCKNYLVPNLVTVEQYRNFQK